MKLTLNDIKSKSLRKDSYEKLLKSFNKTSADDTVVSIQHLLNSNGIDDTLWVIYHCIPNRVMDIRNMCADFAESVLYIFEEQYPNDKRPRQAIEIFRKEDATQQEMAAAMDAAWATAINAAWDTRDTGNVSDAARAAAWATRAACADRDAGDVRAAWATARYARAAGAAERQKQKEIILKYFG
jgi:hypothetical protein